MHAIIYLNKSMVEVTKARVAPVTAAMLYGRGVFTTVAFYASGPFLWNEHWQRLVDHAARLNISTAELNEESIGLALKKLISVNDVSQGRARVMLLDRNSPQVWHASQPGSRQTDLVIMTADSQTVRSGVSLAVSPFRLNTLSPVVGLKTLNYLDHVLSWEEAHRRDFDEAVMLNERGEIVSTTLANIFWVKDGTVYTPVLSTGAMAGVTRGQVIKLAKENFIPLIEGVYEMSDLADADEIFLTSAGIGLAIVTTFDFRTYSVVAGSVVAILKDAFARLTAEL